MSRYTGTMRHVTTSLLICMIVISCFVDIVSSQIAKPPTKPIISFCVGTAFGCAVFDNKKMKCWGQMYGWGSSSSGSDLLGDIQSEIGDSMPYINIGTGIGIEQVSCGVQHVCMRLDTGDMKCLGSNGYGQTGMGLPASTDPIGSWNGYIGNNLPVVNLGSGLKVLDIALGGFHSCVVVTGNKVKCYGNNAYGKLGYGDQADRGTSALQMGNNLIFVDLGTGVEVASIHSGNQAIHNCVILSAPTVSAQRIKCWGSNLGYQLGYGDQNNRGDTSGEMGDNLLLVDLGTESRVKQLAFGLLHTCALLVNNSLKCWGYPSNGQLGTGGTNFILSSTGNSMPFVQIDSGKTVKLVTAGYEHTCIVYDDSITMKCVGVNSYGQLGQGDTVQRGHTSTSTFPLIPAIQLGTESLNISSIYAGYFFTCVVFEESSVKCFGENNFAQLATGFTSNGIGDERYEMGKNLTYAQLFSPTQAPTQAPTIDPTQAPTITPSLNPTNAPTVDPTISPTMNPTNTPTINPTIAPTISPSINPTLNPTKSPILSTKSPSKLPTSSPTRQCDYPSAKICEYDYNCMWTKVDDVKQCIVFDCTTLNKNKCGKQRTRCKWNKKDKICNSKIK